MRAPGYSLCLNWCPGAASFPSSIQAVPRVASHLSEGGGREGCVPSHLRAGEKREPSPASLVKLHVESHPQTQRAGAATQSKVHLPSGGLVTCSPSSSSEGGEERQEEERQEGRTDDRDERKIPEEKERERERLSGLHLEKESAEERKVEV